MVSVLNEYITSQRCNNTNFVKLQLPMVTVDGSFSESEAGTLEANTMSIEMEVSNRYT